MKKLLLQASLIIAISLVAAAASWWVVGPPPAADICDPATLKSGEICLQDIPSDIDILWVDARSRSDWESNGLSGSILWNLDIEEDMNAFEENAAMKILNTPYVIVYCDDRECGTSKQIAQSIRDLDMGAKVHVLHGGWEALHAAGMVAATE